MYICLFVCVQINFFMNFLSSKTLTNCLQMCPVTFLIFFIHTRSSAPVSFTVNCSNSASLSLGRLLAAVLMLGNEVRSDKLLYLCTSSYGHTRTTNMHTYIYGMHKCMSVKRNALCVDCISRDYLFLCFS